MTVFSMVRIVPHLHLCAFNRLGSFTAFGAFDSNAFGTDRWTQINVWERIARGESTRNVLDDICALLHLQVPSPLPAATPASLTYRVITAMLRIKTFSPVRWCCLNGVLDSSGFEGCEIRRGLFAPFPAVKAPSNSEVHISSSFAFGLPLFFRIRHMVSHRHQNKIGVFKVSKEEFSFVREVEQCGAFSLISSRNARCPTQSREIALTRLFPRPEDIL